MTAESNPQAQVNPGEHSGAPAPTAPPPVARPPDSHGLPGTQPNPQAAAPQEPDWKARYQGFDAFYQKEVRGIKEQLGTITETLATLAKPAPVPQAPAPDPKPAAKKSHAPVTSALDDAMAQVKATQYRDSLLDLYSGKGEAGEGLPLELFKENIPVIAPEIVDGKLDDSAQRKAITDFVSNLKGLAGEAATEAQRQVLAGEQPGSSVAPPPPGDVKQAGDDLYQEFTQIMQEMGSEDWLDLDPSKQAEKEARYYELLEDPAIEDRHEGQLSPNMDLYTLTNQMKDMAKRMQILEGQSPFAGK